MKPFFSRQLDRHFVATTGYTGEDGWEVILPATEVAAFWAALRDAGVQQCGLGARDTLRLEAGMNLYGNDMDENLTPLESGLTWTVAFDPPDRDFIGRAALEAQRSGGVPRKLVGLVLEDRGVLRSHQKVVVPGVGEGELTSGTFSPTLERSIGFARVPGRDRRASTGRYPRQASRRARGEVSVRAQRQSIDRDRKLTGDSHVLHSTATSSTWTLMNGPASRATAP